MIRVVIIHEDEPMIHLFENKKMEVAVSFYAACTADPNVRAVFYYDEQRTISMQWIKQRPSQKTVAEAAERLSRASKYIRGCDFAHAMAAVYAKNSNGDRRVFEQACSDYCNDLAVVAMAAGLVA